MRSCLTEIRRRIRACRRTPARAPGRAAVRTWLAGVAVLAAVAGLVAASFVVLPVDLELTKSGSNYDDICFWRNPTNSQDILAFVTAKGAPAVEAFRLSTGAFVASIGGFTHPNNCDIGGNLLVTTDPDAHRVQVHHVPDLAPVATLGTGFSTPMGVAVLHEDGRQLAFITDTAQQQVHVYDLATFQLVRRFPTGLASSEAIAADDLYDRIYVVDGLTGVARAFTSAGALIAEFGKPGIEHDGEGIGLYRCGTRGWLVVSDQQEGTSVPNEFEIFERNGFAHVGTFLLQAAGADDTTATDGVDIFQGVTTRFPNGVLGACDKCSGSSNEFDLIAWERIAGAFGLDLCPEGRPPTCGDGLVNPAAEQCDLPNDAACPGRCTNDCTCAPPPPACGDGRINRPEERCDGADDAACPGLCRADCTCPPVCGDGIVNQATELCDGAADAACPGHCGPACECVMPPVVTTLGPVADTYIEAGTHATRDHGAADHLDADASPLAYTYLKFDLSGIRGPVGSAMLTLVCRDASANGGTVHPVGSSTWIEGDRTGATSASASGPGLEWNDVDTNRDGKIDPLDLSPWKPDFTTTLASLGKVTAKQVRTVDVTTGFQTGPGLYTLALRTASTDRAGYAAREFATVASRPQLVVRGPGCATDADCSDGNPCTADHCDVASGCLHTANTVPCDDGNACTVGEQCASGTCVGGAPRSCNDGNPCTTDTCDPATGCRATPNTATCNDNNVCTTVDRCSAGECVGSTPRNCDDANGCTDDSCDPVLGCRHLANTAPCSDGNACTTGDVCAAGACVSGGPRSCDDGNVCTDDGCDPASGCTHTANTVSCDDGSSCTTVDTCVSGVCAGGAAVDCDDANPCTDDSCDRAHGCVHTPNTAPCEDGNPCTSGDTCAAAACVGGPAPNCNDGNGCTDDSCDPAQGCVHPPNTAPCSDGNACTTDDQCAAGACSGGPSRVCDDGNGCTDNGCDPAHGCVYTPNTAPCDDGSACTTGDTCAAGACGGGPALDCDDGNGCTDDGCDPAHGCVHTPNTAPCDDGSACTTGDTCDAGACGGGPAPDCDDGNGCTDDGCDPTRGCVRTSNAAPCDDGNACTTGDTCAAGACTGGAAPDCDDGNACTADACDPGSGCTHVSNAARCVDGNECTDDACAPALGCVYTPNHAACEDGSACTTGDVCAGGACVSGAAVTCDDGNGCTDDTCDPAEGCGYVPNVAPCDDGDACSDGDACLGGTCIGTAPHGCDDGNPCTDDTCDPMHGCVHTPNAASCSDGNACTTGDTCAAGTCVGGAAPSCNDANGCTDDRCDPASGCVHTPNTAPCDDGSACTTGDTCAAGACAGGPAPDCNDGNGCTDDGCTPAQGCVHPPNAAPCSDGNPCTTGDTCSAGTCAGGPAPSCDDGNGCTDDGCDPAQGCVHPPNTAPCSDGNACTTGDRCAAGTCAGGPAPSCDDGNGCTDDRCDPAQGCVYTPNTAPCSDGNVCTTNDRCAAGACAGGPAPSCDDGNVCTDDTCDPAGGCVHTPNAAPCNDGNACTTGDRCAAGTCAGGPAPSCDDGNPCTDDACDPVGGCAHAANTASCSDGNPCTIGDVCGGGTCQSGGSTCGNGTVDAACGETCDGTSGSCAAGCIAPGQPGACTCPGPVTAVVEADTSVQSSAATTNFGTSSILEVDGGPGVKISLLRVRVSGVAGRTVSAARLRLRVGSGVDAGSVAGGSVHRISSCAWTETGVNWNTRPAVDGPTLATAGTAAAGQTLTFDVTSAVPGDGVYCFALDSTSTDGVDYLSREAGGNGPAMEVVVSGPVGPTCGDGVVNQASEECDDADSTRCPGICRSDCTCPPPVGTVEADTFVQSDAPATNNGTATLLSVDAGPGVKYTFLRARVSGVGTRHLTSARLRLGVATSPSAESVSGGSVHAITFCDWTETAVTWNTKPAIDGPPLATLGAVAKGQVVEFDVTSVVPGDGVYCFAIDSTSTDGVDYNSREGAVQRPALVLTAAP